MADILSADLVRRIRERIRDDWRRTGDGDWQRTPPHLRKKQESPSYVGTLLQPLFDAAFAAVDTVDPLKALEPLSERTIEKLERQLGFRLPGDLRQLYNEIADGGFGPFNGIRRLANWAKDYLKLRTDLEKDRGHPWPETLLPLVFLNGRRICLDRDNGQIVLWDRPPKRCSQKKWQASFVEQASSLESWLEQWVETKTSCEGGPEGGWIPASAELGRREKVAAAKALRQQAAVSNAATFELATLSRLDEDLVRRLKTRIANPNRRTTVAETFENSQPVDLDAIARNVRDNEVLGPEVKTQLSNMAQQAGMLSKLLGLGPLRMATMGSGTILGFAGRSLGNPVSSFDIADAATALGFPLPTPLVQIYELADGGFGPGDNGLLPLKHLLKEYRNRISKPQGPNDEPWPARLLPLTDDGPQVWCLDLQDGKIVRHDLEDMQHLGRGQWERSFRKEANSFGEWLESWLAQPSLQEEIETQQREVEQEIRSRNPSPVTGYPMQLADPKDQAEAEITFLGHSRELRADFGLPENDWENEIRRKHGVV